MQKLVLIFIIVGFIIFGCAYTGTIADAKIYENGVISEIDSWHIGFEYETGVLEEKTTTTGEVETTTKKSELAVNLQLLDDIYYFLKDSGINVYKENGKKLDGFIKIHAVYKVLDGKFSSVRITFYDKNNNLLGRINIDNDPSFLGGPIVPVPLKDTKLAEFCGKKILEILKQEDN